VSSKVIQFSAIYGRRLPTPSVRRARAATITILPVIRVERAGDRTKRRLPPVIGPSVAVDQKDADAN